MRPQRQIHTLRHSCWTAWRMSRDFWVRIMRSVSSMWTEIRSQALRFIKPFSNFSNAWPSVLRIQQTTRYFYNKSIDKTAAPVISRRLFSHLFSFSRPVLSLHLVISLFLSYDMDKLNLQPRGDLCILTPGINGLRFFIYTVSLDGSSSPPMFP